MAVGTRPADLSGYSTYKVNTNISIFRTDWPVRVYQVRVPIIPDKVEHWTDKVSQL